MSRYIDAELALLTIKKRLYETALNNVLDGDGIVSIVYEEIAKNRLKIWIDEVPTADVVEKERFKRVLENSSILAESLKEYQNLAESDVREVVHGEWEDSTEKTFVPSRKCSACGEVYVYVETESEMNLNNFNFCPNCGALMSKSIKFHEAEETVANSITQGFNDASDFISSVLIKAFGGGKNES